MAKGAKSMMQPINLIFRFLNHKSRVCIWLVEQNQVRAPLCCAVLSVPRVLVNNTVLLAWLQHMSVAYACRVPPPPAAVPLSPRPFSCVWP